MAPARRTVADSRLRTAGLVVLVVLVVGFAAASITATTEVRQGGGAGVLAGDPPVSSESGSAESGRQPLLVWFVAAVVALFVVGVVSDPREFLRRTLSLAVAALVLAGLLVLVMAASAPDVAENPQRAGEQALNSAEETAAEVGISEGPSTTSPALLLALGVAVLLLFCVLAALTDGGAERLLPGDGAPAVEEEDTLTAVGRSAGRAAERLEGADADVDNEVYRAWEEMTDHLDVDDRGTRTPGEFRTEALAAGMARDHVDLLTDLFEAVRYGGAPATAEREREAIDALRRIEATYADADDGS